MPKLRLSGGRCWIGWPFRRIRAAGRRHEARDRRSASWSCPSPTGPQQRQKFAARDAQRPHFVQCRDGSVMLRDPVERQFLQPGHQFCRSTMPSPPASSCGWSCQSRNQPRSAVLHVEGWQHHADHVGKLGARGAPRHGDRTDLDGQHRESLARPRRRPPHRHALMIEGRIQTVGMTCARHTRSSTLRARDRGRARHIRQLQQFPCRLIDPFQAVIEAG